MTRPSYLLLQFLGACLQPERTMLVTEFMGGGDLRAALSRHPGAFRWGAGGRGRALALDIARGLHYLHARRIIHFDLKSNSESGSSWVVWCWGRLFVSTW